MHSGHILPFESNVPMQRKVATLKGERIRALRNCSSPDYAMQALTLISNRFLANGYPQHPIKKHIYATTTISAQQSTGRRRLEKDKVQNKNRVMYVRLPYLGTHSEHQFRTAIRKAHLPVDVRPVFVTPPPLSVQIMRPSKAPCGNGCICGDRLLCNRKNVVYKVTCKLCSSMYIGETARTLRTRIEEHLGHSSSNVHQHFKRCHHYCTPTVADIEFDMCESGFADTAHRRNYEAHLIVQERPDINIQYA